MIPRILLLASGLILCLLSITESKTVITDPEYPKLYVQEGGSFTLKCEQDECKQLEWLKADKLIDVNADSDFDETSEQEPVTDKPCITKSTLTKVNVEESDGGNYQCQTKDKQQNFIMPVTVIKVDAVDAVLGDNQLKISLSCDVEGFSESGLWVWSFNGSDIVPDNAKYIVHDTNVTLDILEPDHKDIGVYKCKFDKDSLHLSQDVNLFSKPVVEHFEQKSKNLVQGDPLVLHAKVWGHPKPSVAWLKDDMPLDTSDPRISLNSSMGVENASLRIENLDFADRAEYTIIATNEYGSGNATIMVRVKDKLAALWPFLGIVCEVVILCAIIFIYERRRAKKMEEEELPEEAGHLTNSNDHKGKDDVRHRKA